MDRRLIGHTGIPIGDEALARLYRAGVRGVRFNVLFKGGTPLAKARAAARRSKKTKKKR